MSKDSCGGLYGYQSEHRDEVNKKVMAHWEEKWKENPESMEDYMDVMDMKRLSTGGFSIEVSND